jgi:hypothetical protein
MPDMAERFDPAPFDKHADDPAAAAAADRKIHDKLNSGLEGSFPASDPPSATQPSPSRHFSSSKTWWQRIVAAFK